MWSGRAQPYPRNQTLTRVLMSHQGKISRLLELVSATTLGQISRMEALFDSCNDENVGPCIIVKEKKKKNSKDPSLISPTAMRSKVKANTRSKSNTPHRKRKNQIKKEEARRNIADGTQRNI